MIFMVMLQFANSEMSKLNQKSVGSSPWFAKIDLSLIWFNDFLSYKDLNSVRFSHLFPHLPMTGPIMSRNWVINHPWKLKNQTWEDYSIKKRLWHQDNSDQWMIIYDDDRLRWWSFMMMAIYNDDHLWQWSFMMMVIYNNHHLWWWSFMMIIYDDDHVWWWSCIINNNQLSWDIIDPTAHMNNKNIGTRH